MKRARPAINAKSPAGATSIPTQLSGADHFMAQCRPCKAPAVPPSKSKDAVIKAIPLFRPDTPDNSEPAPREGRQKQAAAKQAVVARRGI